MPKTYRVELSNTDRQWLLEFIGHGEASAREQTRARVLLKADEGPEGPAWNDDRVAEALELSSGGVAGIRRRFSERGTQGTVERKGPERKYDTKLDGEQEARVRVFSNETPVCNESNCSTPVCSNKAPGSTGRHRYPSSCVQPRSGSDEQPTKARLPIRQRSETTMRNEGDTAGSL